MLRDQHSFSINLLLFVCVPHSFVPNSVFCINSYYYLFAFNNFLLITSFICSQGSVGLFFCAKALLKSFRDLLFGIATHLTICSSSPATSPSAFLIESGKVICPSYFVVRNFLAVKQISILLLFSGCSSTMAFRWLSSDYICTCASSNAASSVSCDASYSILLL